MKARGGLIEDFLKPEEESKEPLRKEQESLVLEVETTEENQASKINTISTHTKDEGIQTISEKKREAISIRGMGYGRKHLVAALEALAIGVPTMTIQNKKVFKFQRAEKVCFDEFIKRALPPIDKGKIFE